MSRTVPGYIGEALQRAREEINVTQAEVADALGVTPPIVSRAEGASQRLTVEKLVQFAIALGVEPAELMPSLAEAREMLGCGGIPTLDPREPAPKGDVYIAAVLDGAREFLADLGRPPTTKSGDATAYVGFDATWDGIDAALRRGSNGLPPGGSLRELLIDHGVLLEGAALEDAIVAAAERYLDVHGRRPTRFDGDATDYIGQTWTWSGINSALVQGARGLTQLCTLTSFLERRGVPRSR